MNKMLARGVIIAVVIQWAFVFILALGIMIAVTEILFNWPVQLPEGYRDMLDWYLPI